MSIREVAFRLGAEVTVLIIMIAVLGGCSTTSKVSHGGIRVDPMVQGEVMALDADQIIQAMRIAGLSDERIIESGPALRNALASAGGAFLRIDGHVEAIFAIDGQYLHISSRSRGSFSYLLSQQQNTPADSP